MHTQREIETETERDGETDRERGMGGTHGSYLKASHL